MVKMNLSSMLLQASAFIAISHNIQYVILRDILQEAQSITVKFKNAN